MGKRKRKAMTKKKSSGRSGQNGAGKPTIPCRLSPDRPDAVERSPTRKTWKIDRVEVQESPDGLPEGWIMEIRPRKRGQKTDKYYIDPVHGYGLLSKKDVFRYLQNKEEFHIGFRIERIRTTDAHSTVDESIPILRLRNRNQSSTKEPISNADIPQIASSSSWRHASTNSDEYKNLEQCHENKDHSKLEGKNVPQPDECILEEKKNQTKKVTEPPMRKVEKTGKEPIRKSKRLSGCTNDLMFSNDIGRSSRKPGSKQIERNIQTTVPEELHEETLGKAHSDDDPDKKDTAITVEIQGKLKNLEEKQNQSEKANRPPKRRTKNMGTKSARTTKRLTRADIDPPSNDNIEKGSIKPKPKKFEQSMRQTVCEVLQEGKLSSRNHIAKEISQKADVTELYDGYIEEATKSNNIQIRLENVKPSVEQVSEEYTHSLVSPPRFRDYWSDPCIEFAFKTLTSDLDIEFAHTKGRIQEKRENVQPSEEQASQKQLHDNPLLNTLAFGDSWSDPCIEFAFKTLTSDLDVEDAHIKEGSQEKLKNILQPSVEQASQKQQYTDPLVCGDSWSDPCIEFAFKTLTSDFSNFEDVASVQDYFHYKPLSQCSSTTASVSAQSVSDGKTQNPKNGAVSKIHYEHKFN